MNTLKPLNILPWQASHRLHANRRYLNIGVISLGLLLSLMGLSEGWLLWRERHWTLISQQLQRQLFIKQPSVKQFQQLTQQHQQILKQQQRVSLITHQNQQLMCHLQNILHSINPEIVLSQLNVSVTKCELSGQVSSEAAFNTWLQQLTTFITITQQQLKASHNQMGYLEFQLNLIWQ